MRIKLPWMSRSDRHRWSAARTLEDIGRCTADWLEGSIGSHPCSKPRQGPDSGVLPHADVLAAANRAGLVTIASHPEVVNTNVSGPMLRQHAAVQGFATDPTLIARLEHIALCAGMDIRLRRATTVGADITATRDVEVPRSVYGLPLHTESLEREWGAFPRALGALAQSVQVTLSDPSSRGDTRLWDVIATVVSPQLIARERRFCLSCGWCCGEHPCGDGCTGVTAGAERICAACIDPSVIVPLEDDTPNECANCGAPHYGGKFCSLDCRKADSGSAVPSDADLWGDSFRLSLLE
ncbi:hypothetical protein ACFC1B_07265 [Streptomyces xiamenensis]|uniref:DUF6919 domain-containing protein n=1 Tax=Streptomyces xiamenensis TaxID=408015 RepID=UPI0035DBACE2